MLKIWLMEGSGREEEREGERGGRKQGEKECEVGTPQGSEGPQRTGRPSERGRSTEAVLEAVTGRMCVIDRIIIGVTSLGGVRMR